MIKTVLRTIFSCGLIGLLDLGKEVDFRASLRMVLLTFKLDIIVQILYMIGNNGKPKGHCFYEQNTSEK